MNTDKQIPDVDWGKSPNYNKLEEILVPECDQLPKFRYNKLEEILVPECDQLRSFIEEVRELPKPKPKGCSWGPDKDHMIKSNHYHLNQSFTNKELPIPPITPQTSTDKKKSKDNYFFNRSAEEVMAEDEKLAAYRSPLPLWWNEDEDTMTVAESLKLWNAVLDKEEAEKREVEILAVAKDKVEELYNEKLKNSLKGILVFYVNGAQLPFAKLQELIQKTKTEHQVILDRIPPTWDVMFVPVREGQTRIERLEF